MPKDPVGIDRGKTKKKLDSNAPDPYDFFNSTNAAGDTQAWAVETIRGGSQLLGRPSTTGARANATSAYKGPLGLGSGYVQSDPTGVQLMHDFAQMRGSQLGDLQLKLYEAGFYGSDKPNIGTYDPSKDLPAFRTMLFGHLASGQQTPIGTYLDQAGAHWKAMGAGKTPLAIRVADPALLRVTLQKTAQDLYGQYLSDDQVQNFITSFQGLQAAQQTEAYDKSGYNPETQQGSATGAFGSTTFAPNADAEAEAFIRKNYPNEVAGNYLGNQMNQVFDLLRKPG